LPKRPGRISQSITLVVSYHRVELSSCYTTFNCMLQEQHRFLVVTRHLWGDLTVATFVPNSKPTPATQGWIEIDGSQPRLSLATCVWIIVCVSAALWFGIYTAFVALIR
jgi:hypothetical protein